MRIELIQWKENDDGSANFHLDVDEEGKELLFRVAIKTLIMEAITYAEDFEVKDDSGTSVGNSEWGGADCGDGSGEQPSESEQQGNIIQTSQVSG
jgi:hypothetical protein